MQPDGLRNSGVPLGGLGTGSVELRRDGYFHEWQVLNNRPWGAGPALDAPPDSAFFGLHVQGNLLGVQYRRTAVLGLPVAYSNRFPLLGHYLNDPYHMPWLEHAGSIDAEVRFPFTRLDYHFDGPEAMPVSVSLEAFSPFIPLDAENSGLPLAYFTFRIRNTALEPFTVSLLGGLRNLTGYTYLEQPSQMRFQREGGAAWIQLRRDGVPVDASDNGALALGVLAGAEDAASTSYVFHPRTNRDVWDPFHQDGRLENRDIGDFAGALGNVGAESLARLRRGMPFGALCHTVALAGQSECQITFLLAWHFPNFFEMDYAEKKRAGQPIGHHYAGAFAGIEEVVRHGASQRQSLEARTRAFVDAYYASSFPRWLLDASAAQLTTLVKSSWWDRSGRFGIWEGLGCCGLQTTDITYYGGFPIVQFFPEIQQSQMRLTRDNIEVPGKVPHMMPANFSTGDVDHRGRIDLIPQYILLVWRDVLWTGDLAYAREMWPSVQDALAYFAKTDTDGDGLPNNTGPDQTYDQFPLKGTSAFVGFLYAASLRAAAELADLLGEPQVSAKLRRTLRSALKKLDAQLWNGEYYNLCYDPADGVSNPGVMTDQANSDWFIRQTTGSALLPERKLRSALRAVVDFCTAPQGYLANCAWPYGGAVTIGRHTSDQANSPWSGVEYAAAAHMILAGLEKEGLRAALDVWDRYERAGLRFNHVECGANYYRALSSWAVYLALTGFAWDAPAGALALTCRRPAARFVLSTPGAWGEVSAGSAEVELHLREGALELRVLRLKGFNAGALRAWLDDRPLEGVTLTPNGRVAVIHFAQPLRLEKEQVLKVTAG